MIQRIERETIWNGRQTGGTWFHPRATRLPDGKVLMTCQNVVGSDNFGQVHWSETADNGKSWTQPQPIAAFERKPIEEDYEEGVCDVVPEYHPPTGTVLAMGHNVYYKGGHFTPREGRTAVYSVRDQEGNWSSRQVPEWDDPRTTASKVCGCAQRYTFENGDVLVPMYFGPLGRTDREVTTIRYAFDGEKLTLVEVGRELNLPVNRGLLEPSIVRFGDLFYLTIRAEDGRGYLSTSTDGLNWSDITPWVFDNGEVPEMSSTQQRWLPHSDGLFLVYTRKLDDNHGVARWRAPLLVAQVDTQKKQLIRETEQVVLPLRGDGMAPGDIVARMGNFHTVAASPQESWITVGEEMPNNHWNGDTFLARIVWDKPNTAI